MEGVERRRAQLEENVSKLRQALKHWQTWEFEYEMLKEEIQSAQSPTPNQMIEIGANLRGSLVDEDEVQELLGKDKTKRKANQVVEMISRRIDYVQQNISTVQKQLDSVEKKLAGASVLLEPEMENEEGLPLMEIEEELDEEGNVISSSVLQPGKAAPDIVEALRKAGIQKTGLGKGEPLKRASGDPSSSTTPTTSTEVPTANEAASVSTAAESEPVIPLPTAARKSVSFTEDTKPDPPAKKLSSLEATGYNEELADYNFTKGTKVIEVDENDNEIASYPIIPQGESPEEAALRRQMLQYGLSEVGQVVAEIDLDGPDDYSDEEMDDEFEEYDSDKSEEEDQYGRSTRREISDEYRQQMLELEKKLNARMVENVGPRPDTHPLAEYSDDVRTLKVRKDETFDGTVDISEDGRSDLEPKKKGVRFADNLDISPAPQPVQDASKVKLPTAKKMPTMSETIVERASPASELPTTTTSKSSKVSRFKSSRGALAHSTVSQLPPHQLPEPQPVPQGPKGQTLANTIVERDLQPSNPQVPDEFDPALINREVQVQYHKMRNKMIQEQGGFKPSEEEEVDGPLLEEVDGKTKKVSRFKAAKLKANGL